MNLFDAIEKFSANGLRVDLASAVPSDFCAGAVNSLINALYHPVNLLAYAKFTVLAIAAYLTIYSLQRFCGASLRRMLPSWILIAFLGSVLFVTVRLLPGLIKGWTDLHKMDESLIEYISTEVGAARSVVIVLVFITLPVTALFHYAGHIARAARSWHSGPNHLAF